MPNPGDAKRFGRRHIVVRPDWDSIKLEVMRAILEIKFQHPGLRQKLLDTGNAELVEENNWGDTFWGTDANTKKGQNHLGRIIMEIRKELRP
jgi:ribA/ribD-fused uncharacterized protein